MTAPGSGEQITAELAATFGHEPCEVHTAKGATGRMCCGQCFVDWPCSVVRKIERVMLPVVEAYATRKAAEELLWAATEVECRIDLDMLKRRADALTATPNHGTDAT